MNIHRQRSQRDEAAKPAEALEEQGDDKLSLD